MGRIERAGAGGPGDPIRPSRAIATPRADGATHRSYLSSSRPRASPSEGLARSDIVLPVATCPLLRDRERIDRSFSAESSRGELSVGTST
jgi:hypothetical protein